MSDDPSITDLVTCAAHGDEQAWDALVERYAPLVWSICRRYQLRDADTHDVSQSVWLGLVSHLGQLRDPAALPGWLATTTRRECGKVRLAARAAGYGLDVEAIPDEQTGMAEQELLLAERHAALREALTRLTPRCQRLIALLTEDPPVPYAQISARLGIPVGSIGPCRSRCLDKLRRNPAIAALINTDGEPAAGEPPGQARHPHRLGLPGVVSAPDQGSLPRQLSAPRHQLEAGQSSWQNQLGADRAAWTIRGSHGRRRPRRRAGGPVARAVDRPRARTRSCSPEGDAHRLDLG
jgi:RNA polymerase sigma factor (sigma-70 family)